MRKSLLRSTFTALMIVGLVLVFAANFGVVQAATEVTGVIESDTVWNPANSPYNLTGPVLVSNGVTLTIEAGVTVNFNDYDYYIQVDGTLYAKGNSANPIYFNGGRSISFTQDSSGWNEQTDTDSIIENAILSRAAIVLNGTQKVNNNTLHSGIAIHGGAPSITNNYIDDGIYVDGGSPIISNNTISGKAKSDSFGRPVYDDYGIHLEPMLRETNAYIADNLISGDFTEAAIVIEEGTPTIERNLISNSYGYGSDHDRHQSGIRIYEDANPLIQNNTITKSFRGITCDSSSATIIYNNIHSNTKYNIYLDSHATNDVNATYNWWGTTDTQAINQSIFDFKNDFNLGKVIFTPFLTELNPETAKVPSKLSIFVDASSTDIGSVTVNCMLTDTRGYVIGSKTVSVSYSVTGNNWIPIGSGTTSTAGGECFIQWVNTDSGTFRLKAEWNGDDEYLATSSTTTLTSLNYQSQNIFFIQSTSKVTDLTFDTTNTELSFNVTEVSGTNGYVTATIPKDLLSAEGDWIVLADGNPVTFSFWDDENKTYLQFTYESNTKTIEIIGTTAIPEFTSWIILPLLLTSTLLIIFCRRKLTKTPSQQSY